MGSVDRGASDWTRNDSHADGWADAPPISLLALPKEKRAVHGPKRKNASAGRPAQAQTSCRRRGKVGCPLRQSGTETPCPWGNFWPGEVWDTSSFSFRCRSRFFEEQPAAAKIGAGTDPPTPVARGGPLHRSAPSALFFWTVHCAAVGGFAAYGCGVPLAGTARFLFRKTETKMGVHCPAGNPAEFSGRQIAAPTAFTGEPARIRHRGPARAMSQIRISTPWARR